MLIKVIGFQVYVGRGVFVENYDLQIQLSCDILWSKFFKYRKKILDVITEKYFIAHCKMSHFFQ